MRKPLIVLALILCALPLNAASIGFDAEAPVAPAEFAPTPGWDAQVAANDEMYVVTWTDARVLDQTVYAARFRADGTTLDPSGIAIPNSQSAGAVIWTGRAFLLAYIDDDRKATARTLTAGGALGEPVELFGIYYLGTNRLRMATNGETVLIYSSQNTLAMLDLDGHNLRQFALPWPATPALDVAVAGSTYLVAASEGGRVFTQAVSPAGALGESRTLNGSGAALATDGKRFLLATGGDALRGQLFSREGVPVGETRLLAPGRMWVPTWALSAAWRNGEYLVGFAIQNDSYTLRVSSDGAPTGNVVTINLGPLIGEGVFRGELMDIATIGSDGVLIGPGGDDGLLAAFFTSPTSSDPAPVRESVRVTLAARRQSHIRLARNGSAVVTGWLETNPLAKGEIRIASTGTSPVVVATDAFALVDVVASDGVIWVVWVGEDSLLARRYSASLDPLDATPVMLAEDLYAPSIDAAVAAGGGVVAVVVNRGPGAWDSDTYVEASLLRSNGASMDVHHATISHDQGRDHDLVLVHDGTHFVAAWANATAFYAHRPRYDLDVDIMNARFDSAGIVADAPAVLTRSGAVDSLAMANGANGIAIVWQTSSLTNPSRARRTWGASLHDGVVRDLGGEDLILGSLAAHRSGFLMTRGSMTNLLRAAQGRVEVVTLDGELSVRSVDALQPFTIDPFWRHYGHFDAFDADVMGGATPIVGYARVSVEDGSVSRVFTRGLREVPSKRRAVR
jgi:hypothetical protein